MKRLASLLALLSALAVLMVLAHDLERRGGTTAPGPVAGAPVIEPSAGVYARTVAVVLRPTTPRSRVVWTDDGTLPSATVGLPYTRPIVLDAGYPGITTLRVVETDGASVSPVATASYALGLDASLPVIALVAEPAALWGEDAGILANPTWRGREWERVGHVTGFVDGAVAFELPVGVRVDGREPAVSAKQSLRLYFRQEHGAARLEAPLYPAHPRQSPEAQEHKRLLLQAGRHDVIWTLLRDQIINEVARDLDVPVVEGRFVWFFINGESWGLYRLTERVDRFYLATNYEMDGDATDVVQEGDARDGTEEAWDTLIDWAEGQDFAHREAYAWASAQIDLDNLIDVAILREVFDLSAEGLMAVRPEGGRWFFVVEGGAVTDDPTPDLDVLVTALQTNPEFRHRFRVRAADLLNTVLRPAALDSYLSRFAPPLAQTYDQEMGRWPGVPTWEDQVTALRRYYAGRVDAFREENLLSEVTLDLSVQPPDHGRVYVNGIEIDPGVLGWRGEYRAGATLHLIAVPAPGYRFLGWENTPEPGAGMQRVVSPTLDLTLEESTGWLARFGRGADGVWPDAVMINELWINDNGTEYTTLGGRPLEGDWVELLVLSPEPIDLRGWRLTDNDTKEGEAEGSLIFPDFEALSRVPCGTIILIVATDTASNDAAFLTDDLSAVDGRLIFYVGNGTLDTETDPGFRIGTGNENLALLAPGVSASPADDIGVDFVAEGTDVTPYTFGILADGVTWDAPFHFLGRDDGAYFRGRRSNDDVADWYVDPSACESQDAACLTPQRLVTPGGLNPGQRGVRLACLINRIRGAVRTHD
ncbi:MAG: CotH kinase family protein [Anaerolineae bacterium]